MTGTKADKFLLKVKQASAGHPWYSHAPLMVNIVTSVCILLMTGVHLYALSCAFYGVVELSQSTAIREVYQLNGNK